ncbi:MAG: hypothetical protein IT246_11220 [Bacteroidia bacterium]|nr:hypothetical protein [Bacteroidia bacterium]MCZ2140737.1 hypothetical protein [Bacteroidia bacterium]
MKRVILFCVLCIGVLYTNAQSIFFPNGKVLNLVTSTDVLYLETDIRFYTRNSSGNDYSWAVIHQEIEPGWEVSMCANGDCKIGIPVNGVFDTSLGENDSIVYMRFHVFSNQKNGNSKIGVKVFNTINPTITDTMWYNITYTGTSGYNESRIKIDYTINGNIIQINNSGVKSVTLYNAIGQPVATSNTNAIALPNLHGLYVLNIVFVNNTQATQKIIW